MATGRLGLALATLALLGACTATHYRARFDKPESIVARAAGTTLSGPDEGQGHAFVKCHMKDGAVVVLQRWVLDAKARTIRGNGVAYDTQRAVVNRGDMTLQVADVALFETDEPEALTRGNVVALGVVSVLSVGVTVLCLTNPKTCFGSCPTFYADDGHGMTLQAEGFSSSVARVLEATDVDALFTAHATDGELHLRLTNEALETHAIRHVSLLTVPRPPGGRVVRVGERFYPATELAPPTSCRSESGDCLDAVRAADQAEYSALADANDLTARETIDLVLPPGRGPRGLVIAARNSLLNTFVFYQTLAYMGRRAGDLMTLLERGGPAVQAVKGFGRALGNLDVEVQLRDGSWQKAGTFEEVGPLAREVQGVLLPDTGPGPAHVRLTMARGNFRIDYLAVAKLGEAIAPVRNQVARVLRDGKADPAALAHLGDTTSYLVTGPGDAYDLYFPVPPGDNELFLESTGYYYEWMRKRWLEEEDDAALEQLLSDPHAALRRMAPIYKRIEPQMEQLFWSSRVKLDTHRGSP